jgi:3-oxoacyl-[acyl-carrier protein] reductase
MTRTDNRVALVTGGSRGIGRATAVRLAEDGFDVAFCYASDSEAARDTEKHIVELGRRTYVRKVDVSDRTAVGLLVDGAEDALGPIDAVVTSAGIVRDSSLALMAEEDWHAVLRVDLDGVYHVCQAVVQQMMRRRRGAVVTVSSVAGILGNAGQTNYAAAKAGVIGFTKSLAREAGPYGIRANVVAPGYVETDPVLRLPAEQLELAKRQIPLRRLGRPEEVAGLISYLLSPQAAYITSAVVQIDGGLGY